MSQDNTQIRLEAPAVGVQRHCSAWPSQVALMIVSGCAVCNGLFLSVVGDGSEWINFGVWLQASVQIWIWVESRISKPNAAGELPPPSAPKSSTAAPGG